MAPTLRAQTPGPKVSLVRNRVDPQSPQKCDVITLPVSAVFAIVFGVPDVTRNPASAGIIRFVLYVDPVIFRQSRQWQMACFLVEWRGGEGGRR